LPGSDFLGLGDARSPTGLTPPATSYKSFSVMGIDPAKPDEYVASFKIRKAS